MEPEKIFEAISRSEEKVIKHFDNAIVIHNKHNAENLAHMEAKVRGLEITVYGPDNNSGLKVDVQKFKTSFNIFRWLGSTGFGLAVLKWFEEYFK